MPLWRVIVAQVFWVLLAVKVWKIRVGRDALSGRRQEPKPTRAVADTGGVRRDGRSSEAEYGFMVLAHFPLGVEIACENCVDLGAGVCLGKGWRGQRVRQCIARGALGLDFEMVPDAPPGRQGPEAARKVINAPLRLDLEMVPQAYWRQNLHKLIAPQAWDRIRAETLQRADYRCEICGARGPLECHERWEYDDALHVQHLAGFVALCLKCHAVKHMGFAVDGSRETAKVTYEDAVAQFVAVNKTDCSGFKALLYEARSLWVARSQEKWVLDLGPYADVVGQNPRGEQTARP